MDAEIPVLRKDRESSPVPEQRQLTILIIDDLEILVDALKEGLMAAGYNVLSALSGHEGLRLFKENHVDIVLCDFPTSSMWSQLQRRKRKKNS